MILGLEEYFTGAERFLLPDELYLDRDILVFYKKKRAPIAGYDRKSGCLAEYYKKGWHVERGASAVISSVWAEYLRLHWKISLFSGREDAKDHL